MSDTSTTDIQTPMFDVRDSRTTKTDAFSRMPAAEEAVKRDQNKLDSTESVELHHRLMSFVARETRRQYENRYEQAKDEDCFDNDQWSEEDKEELKDRDQLPIVYNVTAPMVNVITNTQKRSRMDYKILPRRKDGSKPAERKTQLMKYLSDVNRSPFSVSRAFEDATKVGVGWLESGVQSEDDGEPIYDRYESWRNMIWDSASFERDMSDCRYMARFKWVDQDIANSMFPKRRALIKESVVNSDFLLTDKWIGDEFMDASEIELQTTGDMRQDFQYRRQRLRMIEVWFRRPTNVRRLRGGEFSGQIYDPEHPAHVDAVDGGHSVVISSVMMRMHVAIMTVKGLLWLSESPYRHNDYPFTPIWCYRRGRNNLPYGVIRGIRGIQDDVNKRASKSLAILSTNKVVMDEGAVPDLDEFAEEVARPTAIIVKKKGYELTINADRELATAHMELFSRAVSMIQQVSGITDEYMGRTTNAKSGVAIGKRQDQSSLATGGIFDNLRFASQVHGEKNLSLIEQYFTEQKSFRITNMRGTPEYIDINDGLPENDIVRTKADFIISEDDWRATVHEQQTEAMFELLQQLAPVAPQVVLSLLDLLIEKMDIPNRDEMVRRVRQITGMRDPDQETPTPEDQARAAEAAKQKQMQDDMAAAELAEKQAKAALIGAQAQKLGSDTQIAAKQALAAIANQNIASQKAALETALQMLSAPPAVPVADGLLHESGFKSRTESEDDDNLAAAMQQRSDDEQAEALAIQQENPQQEQIEEQQQQGMMK